jgi:hypothetical protein
LLLRLALNSWSFCFSLPSARIIGMHHHACCILAIFEEHGAVCVKYIHIVVQPISSTFLILHNRDFVLSKQPFLLPLSPGLVATTTLLSVSMSLTHMNISMSGVISYCFSSLSLSITSTRFIHMCNICRNFLLINEYIPLYIHTMFCISICPSVDTWLAFWLLQIILPWMWVGQVLILY